MINGEIISVVERNYGIDALRIVAMLMIIHLHMLGHGGLLGAVVPVTSQYASAWLMEVICYGGVNIYALISGYVGYKKELNYSRLLSLWLQTFFYSTVIYVIVVILGVENFSFKQFFMVLFPVMRGHYWYISVYFGMILLTPFINIAIDNCTEKMGRAILGILLWYVTIPCLLAQSDFARMCGGYSAFWLLLLYIVGALSNKFEWYKKYSAKKIGILVISMVVITWVSRLIIAYITLKIFGKSLGAGLLVSYISPTIFLLSLGLLFLAANMKVKSNSYIWKVVKLLSPATLGVYLIHEHYAIRQHLVRGLTAGISGDNSIVLIGEIFVIAVFVYVICTIIELARARLFKFLNIDSVCNIIVVKIDKFVKNIELS